MFSTKNSNPSKPPFYYIAHPHEAYLAGYNVCLGTAHDVNEQFQAYNYYLPMEVVKLIPKLNDYFHILISGTQLNAERMRRKSFLTATDTALSMLHRTDYNNKMGNIIAIGSKHIKPVTWAVIGHGEPPCRMYKFQFFNIYAVIDHYTRRYEDPCHCYPICLYHQHKGREMLNGLVANSPNPSKKLSPNVVMAGALHFLADLLEHGGPDCTEYFDLFTNDLTCHPDDVNLGIWSKARERALFGGNTAPLKRQIGFQTPHNVYTAPYVQGPPPPKPMRIKVVITEEEVDDLTVGVKTTNFQSIVLGEKDIEQLYREYYY